MSQKEVHETENKIKRQRSMQQLKGHGENPKDQTNEEISS